MKVRAFPTVYIIKYIELVNLFVQDGPSSNALKNAKVRIYPSSSCANVEEDILKNWNAQICAGAMDGSTDTCQGGGYLLLFMI